MWLVGLFVIYIVVPMLAMLGLLALAARVGRPAVMRTVAVLVVGASLVYVVTLAVLGPLATPFLLAALAVVVVRSRRLFRSTSEGAAGGAAVGRSGATGDG
jgi:hypothetical protein